MDRKAYSKLYNKLKKDRHEMWDYLLEDYQKAHPKRFAELQTRARYEVEHNIESKRPVTRHATSHGTHSLSEAEILQIIRPDPNVLDYYIHTKDAYGDEHLLFESGYTPEAAALRGQERWSSRWTLEIVRIEPCECPLCAS